MSNPMSLADLKKRCDKCCSVHTKITLVLLDDVVIVEWWGCKCLYGNTIPLTEVEYNNRNLEFMMNKAKRAMRKYK